MSLFFVFLLFYAVDGSLSEVVEVSSQEYVDKHNELRALQGAGDMKKMVWDPVIAEMAQELANTCRFVHGMTGNVGSFKDVGQNLWAGSKDFYGVEAESVVSSWYNEIDLYDYDTGHCSGKMCGHYTQVVWADNFALGCAASMCPTLTYKDGTTESNMHFVVCNYGPGGNYPGVKPFLKGEACSKCRSGKAWCKDGWCDDSCITDSSGCECKVACKNSGIADQNLCSCSCVDGWTGSDCSACPQCKDVYSNCADYAWACENNVQWQTNCPKFCNTCPAAPDACK